MKIKIAVETGFNEDGEPVWQAQGYFGEDSFGELVSGLEALNNERRFWVTAEVPDPVKDANIQEIAGEVTEAPSEDEERSDTASPLATEVA